MSASEPAIAALPPVRIPGDGELAAAHCHDTDTFDKVFDSGADEPTREHVEASRSLFGRVSRESFPTVSIELADGSLVRLPHSDHDGCPCEWQAYSRTRPMA